MQKIRCAWCGSDPLYVTYHDQEWGVPVYSDKILFEFLLLETFQTGLSWITILRKRENFRKAFDGFDYVKIAGYDEKKWSSLLVDPGIIRHKLKIQAAIDNARAFMKIQQEHGSFSDYIWSFTGHKTVVNQWNHLQELPASSPLSGQISKDLKKNGFKFVGPTVMYAFMQAIGMVNDHVVDCFRHREIMSHGKM